jgi:DnaK suppressor protein
LISLLAEKIMAKKKKAPAKKKAPKKSAKKKTATKSVKKKTAAVKKTTAKKKAVKKAAAKTTKKALSSRGKKILQIKDDLLKQKEFLIEEAENAMNALPEQTVFPDLGDQASAETDRSFMLRLRGREQKLLKKIEDAIDRIDTGEYGICDICGDEIGIKRLEARPVTTMCIECKTEQEEDEKLLAQ